MDIGGFRRDSPLATGPRASVQPLLRGGRDSAFAAWIEQERDPGVLLAIIEGRCRSPLRNSPTEDWRTSTSTSSWISSPGFRTSSAWPRWPVPRDGRMSFRRCSRTAMRNSRVPHLGSLDALRVPVAPRGRIPKARPRGAGEPAAPPECRDASRSRKRTPERPCPRLSGLLPGAPAPRREAGEAREIFDELIRKMPGRASDAVNRFAASIGMASKLDSRMRDSGPFGKPP